MLLGLTHRNSALVLPSVLHGMLFNTETTMQVDTIGVIVTFVFGLLAAPPPAAEARQPAKVGILAVGGVGRNYEVFKHTLAQRSWREGRNVTFELRAARGETERLPALAAELARLQVDVIFPAGAPAARAAMGATRTIPIVFETLSDAVAMGFVTNLARPGGNVTGVSGFAPRLGGKWLELLREMVPGVVRVAVLSNPSNPNTPAIAREMDRAARAFGSAAVLRGSRRFGQAGQRLHGDEAHARRRALACPPIRCFMYGATKSWTWQP